MAVFTRIAHSELEPWINQRPCGRLLSFEGISSGIENTNYFVTTTQGRFVLTIFEKLTHSELPFYLQLMLHLSQKKLPVPCPVATQDGLLFSELKGKPATLVNCLNGASVDTASPEQCEAIGAFLAKAHQAVLDFGAAPHNPRGLDWVQRTHQKLGPHLPRAIEALLDDEIAHQTQCQASALYRGLPSGPVHADLFRDNALMLGAQVGGVIDFYFAGQDAFLFDLAVTANDWCVELDTGALRAPHLRGLIQGYEAHRSLSTAEKTLWPDALRAAALRFWTSRLYDFHMPRAAEVLNVKDPSHFERILNARRAGLPFYLS